MVDKTCFTLLNTTDSIKNLTITFNDGSVHLLTLTAGEHWSGLVSSFPGINASAIQSAVIGNASGIIGLELFGSNTGTGDQYLSGVLLSDETATSLYYPHVASNTLWWTGFVAYNPNNTTVTLTISPYDAEGTSLVASTEEITAGGKFIGTVASLFLPAGTEWFKVDASSLITGFELFGTQNGKQLAGYSTVNITTKAGTFVKIEDHGWTGIAFVNIESTSAVVTLTAVNDFGTTIATSTINVAGHGKQIADVENLFAADITGATFIKFSSDRNVVGFQLNSSSDGLMLDGLPGSPRLPGFPVLPVLPEVPLILNHQDITSYDGPSTCIRCHETAAHDMLESLHMQWSGPTPNLTNTNGESLGKAVGGINTFCTYAMSSGGACFGCHVRADGNAPHAPDVYDVDCLMCHNDTYLRTTVVDPNSATTVVDYLGQEKTYLFGAQDADGNYSNVPYFDAMPDGTTMVNLARNVHLPTRKSCLRCHATAGGGDWTKRGDMGLSTINPPLAEDVHMSPKGADLSCVACHSTEGGHKVGGRGIDLRQTEAVAPNCLDCHSATPHDNRIINRHAQGQVSCQVCHIREFGKGGATEMSRDWLTPHWNPAFCNGQGGFVGHEVKMANVKPEYTWFDGTSYVYNLGETIQPDTRGIYAMAKANGQAFDGKSQIVPIKRHSTNTALHESGQLVAPKIMDMFMTGDFDQAVQEGMIDQGLTGSYTIVEADAEMLISHGVEPKSNAPSCTECHDGSGQTPDGSRMVPFAALGYQTFPSRNMCSLCHSHESMDWDDMHEEHVDEGINCVSCHTSPPRGLTSSLSSLCSSCHEYETESDLQDLHEEHVENQIACTTCHTF